MSSWTAVVPFKGLGASKSRLAAPDGSVRARLALAFVLDTVDAVLATPGVRAVVLVTSDDEAAERTRALDPRVSVLQDPFAGLNAAVAAGVAAVAKPDRTLVLTGDLPALTADHVTAALRAAAGVGRAVIPDREGTGTTSLTFGPGAVRPTAFGVGSFARHVELGFTPLPVPDTSTLRLDVDTAPDLDAALEAGVGRHTADVIATAVWSRIEG